MFKIKRVYENSVLKHIKEERYERDPFRYVKRFKWEAEEWDVIYNRRVETEYFPIHYSTVYWTRQGKISTFNGERVLVVNLLWIFTIDRVSLSVVIDYCNRPYYSEQYIDKRPRWMKIISRFSLWLINIWLPRCSD